MNIRSKLTALENISAIALKVQYIQQAGSQAFLAQGQDPSEYQQLCKDFKEVCAEIKNKIIEIENAIPVAVENRSKEEKK